jgi:hypothetical protein
VKKVGTSEVEGEKRISAYSSFLAWNMTFWALLVVTLLAIGGGLWWWFSSSAEKEEEESL